MAYSLNLIKLKKIEYFTREERGAERNFSCLRPEELTDGDEQIRPDRLALCLCFAQSKVSFEVLLRADSAALVLPVTFSCLENSKGKGKKWDSYLLSELPDPTAISEN